MDYEKIIAVADKLGVVTILVIIVFGSIRCWWVPGWRYLEAKKEGEEWKGIALGYMRLAQGAVNLVGPALKATPPANDGEPK